MKMMKPIAPILFFLQCCLLVHGQDMVSTFKISNYYQLLEINDDSQKEVTAEALKLIAFNAELVGNQITCKWQTLEELNNRAFELERSEDGVSFKSIGMITTEMSGYKTRGVYQFKDNVFALQANNILYYRVKQVDNNGVNLYSNILYVRMNSKIGSRIQISPNPFFESLVINFKTEVKGNVEIKMMNYDGKTVARYNSKINIGNNSVQIPNLAGLETGVYIVELSLNGITAGSYKIIKN